MTALTTGSRDDRADSPRSGIARIFNAARRDAPTGDCFPNVGSGPLGEDMPSEGLSVGVAATHHDAHPLPGEPLPQRVHQGGQ